MRRTTYHHGALRDALMAACLRLLESEGLAAVSLRRVAREAGVSTGAPYHHFPDRSALLSALAVQGFQLLASELAAARAAAPDPPAALTALAGAYVAFSREHQAHFRLMFRPELSQPEKHPDATVAGDAAFGVLTDTIGDCVAAGVLPERGAETMAVTFWALAHGLASLWLDGQLAKRSDQLGTSAEDLVAEILRTFTALATPAPG